MLSGHATVKLSTLKPILGDKSFVPVLTKWAKKVGVLKEVQKKVFTLVSFGNIVRAMKGLKNPEIHVSANWLRGIGAVKNEFK